MNPQIYFDVTEFIANPIRTGIQRIVRELLNWWPVSGELVPVVFDPVARRVRTISPEAVMCAAAHASQREESLKEVLLQIAYLDTPSTSRPVTWARGDRVLIPELFFEGRRVQFYRQAVRSGIDIGMIVPDFLIWLRPDSFPLNSTHHLMPYLMLLREVQKRAFISAAVKRTFEERIARCPGGPRDIALDLGADGMGVPRQAYRPGRKELLFIGTLDGRKGQDLIYRAFCERRVGHNLTMTFVGRLPWDYAACLEPLVINTRPDVNLLSDVSDADVAALFENARATIYPSPAEGYGLPPMESLHAGVPVVVHDNLPALEGKPADGQIRINSLQPTTLRNAIESLADDAVVEFLWKGARTFPSASWKSVAERAAAWMHR